jgi:hypothetical protein
VPLSRPSRMVLSCALMLVRSVSTAVEEHRNLNLIVNQPRVRGRAGAASRPLATRSRRCLNCGAQERQQPTSQLA